MFKWLFCAVVSALIIKVPCSLIRACAANNIEWILTFAMLMNKLKPAGMISFFSAVFVVYYSVKQPV